MSILTDIPQRKRFDDFSERGAFHAWMRHAIIFAVIACMAALLITYLVDSRHAKKENVPEKEKTTEKLPVVADLPMKSKPTAGTKMATTSSGTSSKSTKSSTSTSKKSTRPTTSKTAPTHKTTQQD